MDDPWGVGTPPADVGRLGELPLRLARLADLQAPVAIDDPYADPFPAAHELPEVQLLMRTGWRPLDGAPLHCLLPAAWPAAHRT